MEKKIVPFSDEIGIEDSELYPRITELEECIKETVVGQDELIESIATSIYDSIFMEIRCVELIIGDTGTGKTLTMETFGKEMGLPYTIENATQYTQEGYEGESVNLMLSNLLSKAGDDSRKAENGILIIDEIGKKTSKGRGNTDSRDVSGEGVIDSLLPILSGATINIKHKNSNFPFSTKNLKIFLMDACSGLDEIKNERLGEKSVGFNPPKSDKPVVSSEGSVYTKADLIKYGFTPEFVGRLNGIHVANKMDKDTLVRIQKESRSSILLKYEKGLRKKGIELIKYDKFYEEVAEKALSYETGARELENIIKYSFKKLMHDVYDTNDTEIQIKCIKLKEGITEDNTKYEIEYE